MTEPQDWDLDMAIVELVVETLYANSRTELGGTSENLSRAYCKWVPLRGELGVSGDMLFLFISLF